MRFISFFIIFSLLIVSCKKQETSVNSTNVVHLKKGILVLNEGLYSLNNSTLSWVSEDQSLVEEDFFFQKTGRLLGDTGNDLLRYGSKIYVVMNVSSTIEVLDAITGNHLQQLTQTDYNEHGFYKTDGSKIVWMTNTNSGTGGTDWWMMNIDGTNKERLTYFNESGNSQYAGHAVWAGLGSFSPDSKRFVGGRQISLITQEGEIMMVNVP